MNNAQRAHVGLLGSLEAIARAKGEIYAGLAPAGVAVVNADDAFAPYWKELNAGRRIVTFGLAAGADVRAEASAGELRVADRRGGGFTVTLQVGGEHNVRNALAACAAAHALGIAPRAMRAGPRGLRGRARAAAAPARRAARRGSSTTPTTRIPNR